MVEMSELAKSSASGERTLALRFAEGEAIETPLLELARRKGLVAAEITGIGALSGVTLGFFDLDRQAYDRIEVDEQVEVLSLIGNLARFDGEPRLHAHIVVGKRDGSVVGGHLMDGRVRPTLELILNEAPVRLQRKTDPGTGLALLDLDGQTRPS